MERGKERADKMIRPNMNVGDVFTDGNRTFKVLQVVGDGMYVSQVLKDGITPTEDVSEPINNKKYTKTEINRMSTEDLVEVAEKYDIEVSTGTAMKKAIIEKLGL